MIGITKSCPGCGSKIEHYGADPDMHLNGAGYACGTTITEYHNEKAINGPCVDKLVTFALALKSIKTLIKQAESISGKIPTMEDEP